MGRGQVLGEAYVRIGYDDLKKLDSKIDESGRKFTAQTDRMSAGLKVVGGLIAGLGMVKFGNDIFQASLKMENLNKMILANEGSQVKANIAMARYLEMAKLPGLNLTQITQTSTQFKSLGMAVEQSDRTIKALANTLVLAGRGTEEFGRVSVQFQQMLGKGRLMAEDLRVIAESMPQIRGLMTKAFGTSDTDALAKSGVTAAEFIKKITEEMEKLPKAIGGTQNSIDNFKDSLLQFEAALGKNVLPTVGKFLDSLTSMMDRFNGLSESTKSLTGTGMGATVGLLGIGIGFQSIASSLNLINLTKLSALASSLGAIGLLATGAAVAGTGVGLGIAKIESMITGAGIKTQLEKQMTQLDYKQGDLISMGVRKAIAEAGVDVSPLTTAESLYGRVSGSTSYKQTVDMINAVAQYTEKPMNLSGLPIPTPKLSEAELKAKADEAIKADKVFWESWFEYAEAIAKQAIYEYAPSSIIPGTGTTGNIVGNIIGQPGLMTTRQPSLNRMNVNLPPEMRGGVPFGIGGGISNLHQETQDYGESLRLKEKILSIEKQVDHQYDITSEKWQTTMDNWSGITDDLLGGVEKVDQKWSETINNWVDSLGVVQGIFMDIMSNLGYDVSGWKYKDPKLEAERQAQMKANERELTPLGWINKIIGWSQTATGIGAKIATMAEGGSGIVSRPTLFLAGENGREAYNFQPLSSGRSSANTHIEIHSIVMPNTMDRQTAENIVVNAISDAVRHNRL